MNQQQRFGSSSNRNRRRDSCIHHEVSKMMMQSSSSHTEDRELCSKHRKMQQDINQQTWNNDDDDFNTTTTTVSNRTSSNTGSSNRMKRTRPFNLLSLLPLTTNPATDINGQRTPIPFRIEIEMSAWLAWYHYYSTSNPVLPHIQERLSQCDIYFRYSLRDSKFSPLNGATEFLTAYSTTTTGSSTDSKTGNTVNGTSHVTNNINSSHSLYPEGSLLDDLQDILNASTMAPTNNATSPSQSSPHAVIGSARSAVSSAISYMTSAFMVPQISSSSTATYLDNKDVHRFFARTITTNAGDAAAMASYLHYWNVTHVSVLYINDDYGNDFHSDLLRELQSFHITTLSQPYDDLSIDQSIQHLATSQIRYIIALLNPSNWASVLRLAEQYRIIGNSDYSWIFGESSLQFISSSFQLDRNSDAVLARALHGSAVISIMEEVYEPFDTALFNFSQQESLRSMYIRQHDEPDIFNNYTFPIPSRNIYQYFTYDAVTAMMLAACETPIINGEDDEEEEYSTISGSRIYEQLMRTEFQGVSGHVAFHPTTGTRKSDGLRYGVRNIQFPDHSMTDQFYVVSVELTHIITIRSENITNTTSLSSSSSNVEVIAPFLFASNTTTPPLPLPPLDHDLNLIPPAVRIFGMFLCGSVMILSLYWMIWTFLHRNKDVVKASQPIFLCQICIGTFIIASAVIPMGMQEPTSLHGLNIACMATPWLISVGFVATFSALFTKTWRLNKLFHNSRNFRRVVIRPKDVVLPFLVLMIVNCGIMLAWTVHAPLVWERQPVANFDTYGRNVESFGRCVPSNSRQSIIYLVFVVAINISVLLFANYQAYIARNISSEFSESTFIAVAMGSLLEVFILGIPLLFVSSSDPSISFLIRSILTIVTSLSALLPIFVPKYIRRNINERYNEAVLAATGSAPKPRGSVHTGFHSQTLSLAIDSEVRDESDAFGNGRGVSKIERNHDYFKEMETSLVKKSSRASFTHVGGRPSVPLVDMTSNVPSSQRRSTRRSSLPTTWTERPRKNLME